MRLRPRTVALTVKHAFIDWITTSQKIDYCLSVFLTGMLCYMAFVPTAVAQVGVDQASNILCTNSGIDTGTAITTLVGFFILFMMGKGVYRVSRGVDLRGSNRQELVKQGNSMLKGGIMSIGAALAPALFIAFLELIGFSVASCIFPTSGGGSQQLIRASYELVLLL